jgi:hypothetical protein
MIKFIYFLNKLCLYMFLQIIWKKMESTRFMKKLWIILNNNIHNPQKNPLLTCYLNNLSSYIGFPTKYSWKMQHSQVIYITLQVWICWFPFHNFLIKHVLKLLMNQHMRTNWSSMLSLRLTYSYVITLPTFHCFTSMSM